MKQPITLDNLRWLLASLALVLAPLFAHLTPWVPLFALLLGLWRYHIALHRLPLPRLRILLPLTLVGAAAIAASHEWEFGRDASVALLTLMLSMKLLEADSRRDAMLLVFLAWFLGITVFLFSQSLLLGAYMALPVVALTVTLIGVSHPGGTLPVGVRLRLAGRMLGQAVPVMLVLFLLFPRLAGPLWSMPRDAVSGMTGLAETMSPGSISQLSRSDAVAFRAEFGGKLPAPAQRYWRGPVFWHFDGQTWRPGMLARALPRENLDSAGDPVSYTVTLEPHNRTWLFALDQVGKPPPDSMLGHDYQLVARQPVQTRMRYQVSSFLQYRLQARLAPAEREHARQLPAAGNPRTRMLGQEWAASGATPAAIAQRALAMFREQPFVYTLTPPLLGNDGVDEFLFSARRGFCEHYAGSFVFLMRAAGVPARVVTGYQGGEVNPLGNYMLVRQADAHAWAEIWLEGRGWVRVDPTAAVSPQRVEAGVAAALSGAEPVPMLMRGGHAWLHRIFLGWDALNNGWNQWVLGYNQQRQMELLSRFVGGEISLQHMALGLLVSVTLIMLAISWAILRGNGRRGDSLQAVYLKFLRKLARTGVVRQPHEGPLDFGRRAAAALPDKAQAIADITAHYAGLRYGSRKYAAERLEELRRSIRGFRA